MKVGVSSELLDEVLDILSISSGLRQCDIAECVECSPATVHAAVNKLVGLGCVSVGAVQYLRNDGEITLKKGYFYEQGLPQQYPFSKRRNRRRRQNGARSL